MRNRSFKIAGLVACVLACLTVGTGIGMAIQPQDTYNETIINLYGDDGEYHCVEIYLENVNTSWDHWIRANYYVYNFYNLSVEHKTTFNLVMVYLETTEVWGHGIVYNLSINGFSSDVDGDSICGINSEGIWTVDRRQHLFPNGTNYEIQFNVETISAVPFNLTVILGYTVE